jgi:hypothetical protein
MAQSAVSPSLASNRVLCCADTAALKTALEQAAIKYTIMRTGTLGKSGEGGGLLLGEVDDAVCEEVPIDDVFRFITEAMTISEAEGREFSLCPSADASQLKQMRLAGCSR